MYNFFYLGLGSPIRYNLTVYKFLSEEKLKVFEQKSTKCPNKKGKCPLKLYLINIWMLTKYAFLNSTKL